MLCNAMQVKVYVCTNQLSKQPYMKFTFIKCPSKRSNTHLSNYIYLFKYMYVCTILQALAYEK